MSQDQPKRSKGKGCLIACLLMIGLSAYTLWQIGAPARRARLIHGRIQTGMNLDQVENVVKETADRHYILYQVVTNGSWRTVSRDEFTRTCSAQTDLPTSAVRIHLTFMSSTPYRVSFFVQFDKNGRVANVTAIHGWD